MRFDELHQLQRFFSTMELSEAEKKERCDFAFLFYDAIWYTFALFKVDQKLNTEGSYGEKFDENLFRNSLRNRISDVIKDSPCEPEYIDRLVDDITETTKRHLDDPYYFSKDRAVVIAQNEANSIFNYGDYDRAVKEGKQWKTWITENDNLVRLEHEEVDMMRIPINEYFHVGEDTMLFPHDYLNGSPSNLINCRCICTYE